MTMPATQHAHAANLKPHDHRVQFYSADEQKLIRNIRNYVAEGVKKGDRLLLVSTEEHWRAVADSLRASDRAALDQALFHSRIVLMDAQSTLARILVAGEPEWDRFSEVIGGAIRHLREGPAAAQLRAFGEMMGILWERGDHSAAVTLEGFWNSLLRSAGFTLYCAYPIDIFQAEFADGAVQEVLHAHSLFVPSADDCELEMALNRALNDYGDASADRLKDYLNDRASELALPRVEAAILSLTRHADIEDAGQLLARAREYYRSQKHFRALIENGADAISLLDSRGKVFYTSSSSSKVLGYEPHDLVGRQYLDLFHPDDRENASKKLGEVVTKRAGTVQVQARMTRKDGTWCWVESDTSNLLDNPDVRAIVSNYRDITKRKAAEEKLQRDADEIARYNAELQALAYAVAHDLSEPLRTVSAYTELLAKRAPLDNDSKRFTKYIVDGVTRMSDLLDDVLALAGLNMADAPERVDLNNIVDESVKNLDKRIKETDASIRHERMPVVMAQAGHMVQLFQNLIGNAIKYRSAAKPEISIQSERVGGRWLVKVSDNGIGIAPEYHEHIFGLFKRLHSRAVDGTGIGLTICKKIVEGMGGKIWVESAPGKGSTFCFTLAAANGHS